MIKSPLDHPTDVSNIIALFYKIVPEAIDIEYQRFVVEQQANQVYDYLLNRYTSVNYYTFFTMSSILSETEYVFEHPIIRDFFMNVTERVMLQLHDVNHLDDIIEFTAHQCTRTKQNSKQSLMIDDIRISIAINKDVLKQCLTQDTWLMIVFYSIFLFDKTQIHQHAINAV